MDYDERNTVTKLEKKLMLLKEEYSKLQQRYQDLEKKYSKLVPISNDADLKNENNSFVARLLLRVASLYGSAMYSDLSIKLKNKSIPAHKFVLHARSEEWRDEVLADVNELDWSDMEEDIADALLRWIYMDVVDLQKDFLSLGLIRCANRFQLSGLLLLCEQALIASIGLRTCIKYYCVAEEVGATSLLKYSSELISEHWDDLKSEDFEHMSASMLFKLLKEKTKHYLHAAVRLQREDVVFLCLLENEDKLPDIVNSLSDQGQLPLQMALTAKNLPIAETLFKNGFADVNAYTKEGNTLLLDALKNGNYLAANFLLDCHCLVDLTNKHSLDTALHIICGHCPKKCDDMIFQKMVDLGKKILLRNPNVNIQNKNGYTALHKAIESQNTDMISLLLGAPDININLRTNDEKSALELSLSQPKTDTNSMLKLARKLLELGARTDLVRSDTQENLLHVLTDKLLEESAIFLIDFVDLNQVTKKGFSVLHIAAQKNLYKLIARLLRAGALPNQQSSVGELKSALHFAVESNSAEVIDEFVKFRESTQKKDEIDFNCKDAEGDTPLSLSLALNHLELVPLLIRGGADVNMRYEHNITLLHKAILNKNVETALFLLDQGADANLLTENQESPLELAVHSRLPRVVEALCLKGVAINSLDKKGNPPLWIALELGYEDIAQILLQHGVDTDCWGTGPAACKQTLLHRALDENKENIAHFLIISGCDIDSPRRQSRNGDDSEPFVETECPLHLCAKWGLIKALQSLIDHGANINAVGIDNKTPLHIAIENQHDEVINILLCHPGIDLKFRDKSGNTPFATALTIQNHKAAQQILNRWPHAAEQLDQRGRNFLHLAIMRDDLESVLFLISIQVDVNSRVHDANQTSPLHLAAASHNEMIIRNLILAGARVNERDALKKMPLHIAVEQCNLAAVSALIQNNADYDAVDSEGNNALHLAVREGQISIVRELLTETGINAEALNYKGRNALHELCRTGEDKSAAAICELFLECMPDYRLNIQDMDGNTPLLLSFMRGQASLCQVLVRNGACLGAENHDGLSIFNFKLATDQLLQKLLDQLHQESPWSESDLCQECGLKFSLTLRKHHCRHCGRVLCSKCSNNDVPILKFNINKPVRVCAICFEALQGGNRFTQ